MGFTEPTDGDLLAATRSDPEAFASFYDRYETSVVGYFMRCTRDPELAADLTAEVFAAALGAARRYRPDEPTAAGWLFTIARNTIAKSVRRGQVESRARARLGIREAIGLGAGELERVEAEASGDGWVLHLLDRLPVSQREAIRARIVDERTYVEIAADLRTSELVIRKRVSRGLATLKAELERPR
ncbi:MAG TPA: RNA polymerase sigma factor [Solirubrobacteraceae bacterium]|jgi:RNA polymerase sigma-70 factor (ECF subfamily)|nr:RNA polymerase sigma factor [Solirubrobacteraceae bacterium]